MKTDLFGNPYVDPMPSEQMPLFHQPVESVFASSASATDRKIERKFRDTPTAPLLPAELTAFTKRERGSVSREFEAELRTRHIPNVAVDDAKKALFSRTCLSSFDFVVYSKTGNNWIVLCREPNHETRTNMEEWSNVFGDGFKAVFVVRRAAGLECRTLSGEKLTIDSLL